MNDLSFHTLRASDMKLEDEGPDEGRRPVVFVASTERDPFIYNELGLRGVEASNASPDDMPEDTLNALRECDAVLEVGSAGVDRLPLLYAALALDKPVVFLQSTNPIAPTWLSIAYRESVLSRALDLVVNLAVSRVEQCR